MAVVPQRVQWATRVACCALMFAFVQETSAQIVTLSMPPDGSDSFTLRITNPTSDPTGPAVILAERFGSSANQTISAAAPCVWSPGDSSGSMLTVPLIGPNSGVDCVVTVSRNSVPLAENSVWSFRPEGNSPLQVAPRQLRIGAFADVNLSLEQVAPLPMTGETTALFRLRASSDANFSIRGAEVFNCAFNDERYEQYSLNVDFPGGCEFARHTSGVGCPLSLPDNHWILPEIPPGGESFCLIRLVAPEGIPSGILEELGSYPGFSEHGFLVFDESSDDRSVPLQVAFADVAIPLLGRQFTVLLGAMLLTIGALAHYRQKHRAVATSATEE